MQESLLDFTPRQPLRRAGDPVLRLVIGRLRCPAEARWMA